RALAALVRRYATLFRSYVGFVAGWAIPLDYILVPALLYVVSATALTGMWPAIPGWIWLVLFIIINTVINYFGIEFTARTNMIFLDRKSTRLNSSHVSMS